MSDDAKTTTGGQDDERSRAAQAAREAYASPPDAVGEQDIPAPDGGRDGRTRLLKSQAAAVTTAGDEDEARRLREQVEDLNADFRGPLGSEDREAAAARRRAAAQMDDKDRGRTATSESGDTHAAETKAPVGRRAPGKQQA
jgi:hypothetical protein